MLMSVGLNKRKVFFDGSFETLFISLVAAPIGIFLSIPSSLILEFMVLIFHQLARDWKNLELEQEFLPNYLSIII